MSKKTSVKRCSAKRKQEVVLRLLRSENLDALIRETGQPVAVLSQWRNEFLEGGIAALKRRTDDPKVVARSTHYARQAAAERPVQAQRRGRKPVLPDDELVARIREVLSEAEALGFRGEGYRKVWARLRHRGIPTSKERVRRLMREHGLQAPHRAGHDRGPRVHDGTIIPDGPNRMWGTDATQVQTRLEGTATVFVAIDHFDGDVVGIHAARPGTRFEALEPIYQGLREHYGPLAQDIAEGLVLRHDHGPQYMSHAFQQEIAFLGIESSPSFIKAPEGNGVV